MRRAIGLGAAAAAAALLGVAIARSPGARTAEVVAASELALPTRFEAPPSLADAAAEASLLGFVRGVSLLPAAAPRGVPAAPAAVPDVRDLASSLAVSRAAAPPASVPEPALTALALALVGGVRAASCRRRAR